MNTNECTHCGRTTYYCNCRTHGTQSHQPMTANEAREIILRAFGQAEAARILGEAIAA